jgi:hypothetical protein
MFYYSDIFNTETFCYGEVLFRRCYVTGYVMLRRRSVTETFCMETYCRGNILCGYVLYGDVLYILTYSRLDVLCGDVLYILTYCRWDILYGDVCRGDVLCGDVSINTMAEWKSANQHIAGICIRLTPEQCTTFFKMFRVWIRLPSQSPDKGQELMTVSHKTNLKARSVPAWVKLFSLNVLYFLLWIKS